MFICSKHYHCCNYEYADKISDINADARECDHLISVREERTGCIIETVKNGKMNRVFSCCNTDATRWTTWCMPKFCPECGAKIKTNRFTKMLDYLPDEPTENCDFWSDGDKILSKRQEAVNALADFLDSNGYVAITGYYDPKEDKLSKNVDKYTGFYYVTVD